MTIKQRIPNFVSGAETIVAEFSSLDELLSVPFVKKFAQTSDNRPFKQFSVSSGGGPPFLMAEYGQGEYWWAVGYLSEDSGDLNLPEWKPVE